MQPLLTFVKYVGSLRDAVYQDPVKGKVPPRADHEGPEGV
jgi:hypothetical protein